MMMTKVGVLVLMGMIIGGTEAQRGESCTYNGQQGSCKDIQSCPALLDILSRVQSGAASVDALRSAICGFDNNRPLVCCTDRPTTPQTTPTPFSITTVNSRIQSASKLPSECGVNGFNDRIVDGEDAPLGEWPWMVVLRGNDGGISGWFCGGTLISDRYVLTAAHCFKQSFRINLEYARIGEHTLINDTDCKRVVCAPPQTGQNCRVCAPPPQNIPVESIILHPEYESPCKECNDIALLRLSRKATLHPSYVTPICLPVNPVEDMGFPVANFSGQYAWAAGWGNTARDPYKSDRPSTLQQVQLPIQHLRACDQLKRHYPNDGMAFCAGGEGKDTCKGDSGGPLTLTDKHNIKHYLVGVTSLGPLVCGAKDSQGLYTSVNHYIPWILDTIKP